MMGAILRGLSDIGVGEVAGVAVAIALVVLVAYIRLALAFMRRIDRENIEAHALITANVERNRSGIEALRGTLEAVARDVAVLRDRSDRVTPRHREA